MIEMLVVIAIIGLLASLLMPSLARARFNARLTACSSNLRQITSAATTYAADSNGFYPGYKIKDDGTAAPTRGRSYDSVPAELGPYCGGSVNWKVNPLWKCPEAAILLKTYNKSPNNNLYALYWNTTQALYSGTLGYYQSMYIPKEPSEVLQKPGGSLKFNGYGGYLNTWGGKSWESTVLASDISHLNGNQQDKIISGHPMGSITNQASNAFSGLWLVNGGIATANYSFTDGRVQRFSFSRPVAPSIMQAAADNPLQSDNFMIPRAWLRQYP